MAFTIPDNDEAFAANPQSLIMQTDINAIVAGILGDGVVSGCAVTAQGSPDMTVAVASGTVRVSAAQAAVTSGNVTITTADATNPRIDLVVVNSSGTKSVTAGTAAANPKAPDIPASSVLLAMVYVPANDTTMASNQITDKRLLLNNIAGLTGTQSANQVLAGPASGAAAAPAFRALTSTDMVASIDSAAGAIFDPLLYTASGTATGPIPLQTSASGTGAAITAIAPPDASATGVHQLDMGTTTTGRAGVSNPQLIALRFGGLAQSIEWRVQLLNLPDGTESFAVYFGFGDSVSAAPTDGAYFYFDQSTANWRARTRSNTTETDTDVTIAPSAATWYVLRVAVNAAGTSVVFTVYNSDKSAVLATVTNTTNIPTAAGRETGIIANAIKSAGTTSRKVYLDSCRFGWGGA